MRDRRFVLLAGVLLAVFVLSLGFFGCGTTQSAQVDPKSTVVTKADLEKINADIVTVDLKTQNMMTTVNQMKQEADTFKAQIGGKVDSLTQNQFRFESWWAEVSARLRPRILGFGGFLPVVQAPRDNPELGKRSSPGGGSNTVSIGSRAPVPSVRHWYSWPAWF